MKKERIYIVHYVTESGEHCVSIDAYRNEADAWFDAKKLQACGHHGIKVEELSLV